MLDAASPTNRELRATRRELRATSCESRVTSRERQVSIEWKLVELMILARDSILHVDHTLKRRGIRYKRIFFLQPDVVLDNKGNAYMVEVNTNGYMIGNLHKDFFPLHDEQRVVPVGLNPTAQCGGDFREASVDEADRMLHLPDWRLG